MGKIQTTVFVRSHSNFTCKLWMMTIDLRSGVKGQGQLWHSACETLWAWLRLQCLPDYFQTSHVSCWWSEKYIGNLVDIKTRKIINIKCNFSYLLLIFPWLRFSFPFVLPFKEWECLYFIVKNIPKFQDKPCGHDKDLIVYFQTSPVSCWWSEEESYLFWVTGSKVKVNYGTLCNNLVGMIQTTVFTHNKDHSFCQIIFKFHMQVVDDERRNPINFGLWGQRSML